MIPPTRKGRNSRAESPEHRGSWWWLMWRSVRRALVVVVGVALVIIGVVMLVTPGPAIVVIPVGLAMLGVRFDGVRRRARRLRVHLRRFSRRTTRRRGAAHPRRSPSPPRFAPRDPVDSEPA